MRLSLTPPLKSNVKILTFRKLAIAFLVPIIGLFGQTASEPVYNFDRKVTTSFKVRIYAGGNRVDVPAGTQATFVKEHDTSLTVVLEGWKVSLPKGATEEFKADQPALNPKWGSVTVSGNPGYEESNRINKDGPEGIWNSYAVGNEDTKSSDEAFETRVVELTNAERSSRGLKPLIWDRDLARAARYHAADQYVQNYGSHDSKDTEGAWVEPMRERILRFLPKESRFPIGENISYDVPGRVTPEEVVSGWMNSPAHRKNILMPQFKRIGVGFIKGSASPAICVQTFSG